MAVGKAQDVEKYKCDSNEAISMKLVRTADDVLNEDIAFHSWMSHQVFGDSETIFGYKELNIKLYYHAGSLLTYLSMDWEEKIPQSLGIKPDPVLSKIAENLPEGFLSNQDDFISRLSKEDEFTPMGNKIHSYAHDDVEYEIYHADLYTPRLKGYHDRLQTFLLWFIDAASFIDFHDEKWNYFLLFERKQQSGSVLYNIVGYMTVYHYYCYPRYFRPRISQTLVLPPFQRQGHGVQFIETVCKFYLSNPDAMDVTVEDPSEDFVRCRDFVDCRNCARLEEFSKDKLLGNYTEEMREAALKTFKIGKAQSRRVYEILRLRVTNTSNCAAYRSYRLYVKNRLNMPYQKQARSMKRLKAYLSDEELKTAVVGQTVEERMQRLDEAFKQLEDEYRKVIERLAK